MTVPKLLIADDSRDKRDLLREIAYPVVPSPDTSILFAKTTEEAIEMIRQNRSLMAGIIDYEIPSRNGPHIIRDWREIEAAEGRDHASITLYTNAGHETFEDYKKDAIYAGADTAVSGHYSNREYCNQLRVFLRNIFEKEQ